MARFANKSIHYSALLVSASLLTLQGCSHGESMSSISSPHATTAPLEAPATMPAVTASTPDVTAAPNAKGIPQTATEPYSPAVLKSEFLYTKAPFRSCHASTIAETKDGLVAAFFGGSRERNPDVCIYLTRNMGDGWSPLVKVASGTGVDGKPVACWNPVLFQPREGPLMLFYRVGPTPQSWWSFKITSDDQGVTWSTPERLPDPILGPIKDQPIELADGTIISPSSNEAHGGRAVMEMSKDGGKTWTTSGPLNDKTLSLVQPTVLDHGDGNLQILIRSKQKFIYESWSHDSGKTWSAPAPTTLPNPNSGIDATQLADGRSLLVYNNSDSARSPLNIAVSPDGKTWTMVATLENADAQFSYPTVIQTRDGLVRIVYTWKRLNIRYAVIDPKLLSAATALPPASTEPDSK